MDHRIWSPETPAVHFVPVAQCFCICQFPLPPLCASEECAEAHVNKKSGLFHYFLPTSASNCINARNHRSFLQWVVGLHHTQSKLTASLSLLDAAAIQIEEAYQRQVTALAALKDRYIAKVNQMREVATEAFKIAVRETTENAINSEYIPQSDITQWIWTMASKAEDDDTPLFQSEVNEIEEEINLTFSVKVISAFKSMKCWNIEYPGSNSRRDDLERLKEAFVTVERNAEESEETILNLSKEVKTCELRLESLIAEVMTKVTSSNQIPSANSQLEMQTSLRPYDFQEEQRFEDTEDEGPLLSKSFSPLSSHRTSLCIDCGLLISADEQYRYCKNVCQCKICCLQTIFISPKIGSCTYCKEPFYSHTVTFYLDFYEKCHVCGLVVDQSELAKKAPCKVCSHCVMSYKKSRRWLGEVLVGMCSLCKDTEFPLDKREVEVRKMQRACCESEETHHSLAATGRAGHMQSGLSTAVPVTNQFPGSNIQLNSLRRSE